MLLKYNPTNERQFNNGKGKSVRGAYQIITITASKRAANDRDILAYWTVTRYFEWNQLEVWKKESSSQSQFFFCFLLFCSLSLFSHTRVSLQTFSSLDFVILFGSTILLLLYSVFCVLCAISHQKNKVYTRSSQTSSVVSLHKPIHVVDAHIKLILLRSVSTLDSENIIFSLSPINSCIILQLLKKQPNTDSWRRDDESENGFYDDWFALSVRFDTPRATQKIEIQSIFFSFFLFYNHAIDKRPFSHIEKLAPQNLEDCNQAWKKKSTRQEDFIRQKSEGERNSCLRDDRELQNYHKTLLFSTRRIFKQPKTFIHRQLHYVTIRMTVDWDSTNLTIIILINKR